MNLSLISFLKISTTLFVYLLIFVNAWAQPTIDLKDRFNNGKELYERGAYKAARVEFSQCINEPFTAESKYYMASSAIRSGHDDGEQLMNEFVKQYPFHVYAKNAFQEIADFYYANENYGKASSFYLKSTSNLSDQKLFRLGYAQFKLDQKNKSLETFKKLEGSGSNYEKDAAYFMGFIYFENNDLSTAKSNLKVAFDSKEFRDPAMELYVGLLYQTGKYDELIDLVNTQLTPVNNGLVLNYLADAQYVLRKYSSASVNYGLLLKSHGKFRNEENYFRAGYCNYRVQNNEKAIDYLSKSAVSDDSVGAYASYYLGMIYTKNENWHFANTSFQNTAKYSTALREDALFYQGRSLMEIPNYKEAIDVLQEYSNEYPSGRNHEEVKELLGMAYAETNDYQLAIKHIEALERLTPELKATYQRVAFLKGVSLFNDKSFHLAGEYFQKSLIHDIDASITQQSYYWMAEVLSLNGSLDEAEFYYSSVNSSPDALIYLKSLYGRAYAYFNMKNYEKALGVFDQFVNQFSSSMNKKYYSDALLRIGDCHFVLKQYQKGIEYYQKAENSGSKNREHIAFQIGLLNRYLGQDEKAKEQFNLIIHELPKSSKVDHAYFQLAQIDFEKGLNKNAIETYKKLLIKFPNSQFTPLALLNQAIAYDNDGQSEPCISNYKEILNRFPRHQVANSALLGLQDKQASGEFESFDAYLTKYKKANPNSEALENIEFESARANYYAQKYDLAVEGLLSFTETYPNSSLIIEAKYLIGDSYYRQNMITQSIVAFEEIVSFQDFSKQDRVLYRLASLVSEKGNLKKGNEYYYQLSKVSRSARNVMNVNSGLMENHFLLSNYDSTIHYGNKLLNNPKTSVLISAQANLLIGKAYYEKEELDLALQNFLPLVGHSPDERGAEAYYYISRIYFHEAKYDKALESLFILTDNFTNYEIWLGKAYLLMADIYIETDDLFQAKATLNSLIEHATLAEVIASAKAKLKLIEDAVETNE